MVSGASSQLRNALEAIATDSITLLPLRHPGVNEGTIISHYTHWSMGSKGLYSRGDQFEMEPVKNLDDAIEIVYPGMPPSDIDALLASIKIHISPPPPPSAPVPPPLHASPVPPYTKPVTRSLLARGTTSMTTNTVETFFLPNAGELADAHGGSFTVILYTQNHVHGIDGYLTSKGGDRWELGSKYKHQKSLSKILQEVCVYICYASNPCVYSFVSPLQIGATEDATVSFTRLDPMPTDHNTTPIPPIKIAMSLSSSSGDAMGTEEDVIMLLDDEEGHPAAAPLADLLESLCRDTACKRVSAEKFKSAIDLVAQIDEGMHMLLAAFLKSYSPRPDVAASEMRPFFQQIMGCIFHGTTDIMGKRARCKAVLETIAKSATWSASANRYTATNCFFKALDIELSLYFAEKDIVSGSEARVVLGYMLPLFPKTVLELFLAHVNGAMLNPTYLSSSVEYILPYFYHDEVQVHLPPLQFDGGAVSLDTLKILQYDMELYVRRENTLKVIAEIVAKAVNVFPDQVLERRGKNWFKKLIICMVQWETLRKKYDILFLCRRLGLHADAEFASSVFMALA